MTLTDFLLARISEREMLARDLRHQAYSGPLPLLSLGGGTLLRDLLDPEQMLAECAAKRRIVEHLGDAERGVARARRLLDREGDSRDAQEAEFAADAKLDAVMCIAKHVAGIYASHEDFDEDWRV